MPTRYTKDYFELHDIDFEDIQRILAEMEEEN